MITKTKQLLVSVMTVALLGASIQLEAQTKRRASRPPIPKYTVAANTTMRLRLNDKLSSKDTKVGEQFQSTVVDPVYAKGLVVIPQGSIVTGRVTHVVRASRKSQSGSLNVEFTKVELPNGRVAALNGSLTTSASADNEGEVKGGSYKKRNVAFVAGAAVVGGLINGVAGAGIGAGVGIAGALFSKGKEAEVKAGTEYNMILNRSLVLPEYKGGNG
jgi:hypothetical protein